MASREQEKERRRLEREEAERAAAGSAARRRRVQVVLGALAALLVAGGVAFAVLSGGEDDPKGGGGGDVALPAKKTDDLEAAAKTAGCTVKEHVDEGDDHLPDKDATFDDYKTNPPTSGTHRPPPAAPDGVYEPGNSPDKEDWVHTLEHGRVIFQYAPGTPQRRIDQLETLMNEPFNGEPGGFKTAVMENNTEMPFAVAALSWSRSLTCERFDDAAFDALRAFRSEFVSQAPEGDFPWPAS